ncbi:hypothetical protein [Deinococcus roseus]|uniref:DUF1269 domain-containing protein n=1 Tax=Deinococcus roseus TaxID=392414 RepID=A0ABQ2CWJ0_9DEIO|nr:hypothetical protein [Deinococcus roseus]GGJ27836.1 hypothetical protein GCM10008938_12390 [Deinococcus roseus]
MERITAVFETLETAECALEKLRSVGISGATLTTVQNNKLMSVLQQDMDRGSSRGLLLGLLMGTIAGLVLALWGPVGPLLLGGMMGVAVTAVLGTIFGGVLGSVVGTGYDLRRKAHQAAVQATAEHEGKFMVAVDVQIPEDHLKVEDLLKTVGGEVVTTLLPVTAPVPVQAAH